MSLVATLICNPANPALDSTVVDGARAILPSAGPAHWLFDEVAVDIPFVAEGQILAEGLHAFEAHLREVRGDLPIDIVVQPQAARRKKLFLADMDSTMIGQECIDELADFAGLKAHVAAITERAMRGEIAFEPALRERVALLKRFAGRRRRRGAGQAHHADAGRPRAGRDHARPRRLDLPDLRRLYPVHQQDRRQDRLSGKPRQRTHGPRRQIHRRGRRADPGTRDAKLATLVELTEAFDLDDIDTLVVGDGANDLGMIEKAGLGVAYHAKPAVAAAAAARIDHGDLTALLYAQGYRRDEFAGI